MARAFVVWCLLACVACSAADRQTAGSVLAVGAPMACSLVAVFAGDAYAGNVCDDIAGAVRRALLAMPVDASAPTLTRVSGAEPVRGCRDGLVPIGVPGRDPREMVCREYRAQVLRALDVGHAR